MNFEVVAARECGLAFVAMVLFIPCVKLYVAIPTSLVLKKPATVGAFERQFVTVDLLVPFKVAQANEGLITKLTGIRQASPPFLLPDAEITPISYHLSG